MGAKLLLLEDDPVAGVAIRAPLVTAGYRVVTRESPLGLLAAVAGERPDLLLLDLDARGLPIDRLIDLLRHGVSEAVPIVLCSRLEAPQLEALVRAARADAGIRLGDPSVLVERVRACLAAGSRRPGAEGAGARELPAA